MTSAQKNADAMGMTLEQYLQWSSNLNPRAVEVMDPKDPSKAIKKDIKTGRVLGESPRLAEGAIPYAERKGFATAEARTLGSRTANIEMAVVEAQMLAPLALAASEKVDRTKYPSFNKLLLSAQSGTGDENVARLGIAVNSLINIYARAINPTGVATVSDKDHARELLSASWAKGQFRAGVDQLMMELNVARQAPGVVRKGLQAPVPGESKPAPLAAPPGAGGWSIKPLP